MDEQIEIRLLGRLWVRPPDGYVVPASSWTTGKTTDLLRLLAMSAAQTVPSQTLIERLWPGVDEVRATGSLRTATANIRRVLGKDSVTRQADGLRLAPCWVDVLAHEALAIEAAAAVQSREHARVVSLVKEAEALYVDDFHAHDDDSPWAVEIRTKLISLRTTLLAEAADSALELGWLRDAIDLSTLAISIDPCLERAHRALMRAYAGIGEIESALRSYDRCRRNLLTELGAAPSVQTRALHRQLLSWEPEDHEAAPSLFGRAALLEALATEIKHCVDGDGRDIVCLVGSPGSGRQALLRAATDRLDVHLRPVRPVEVARKAPTQRATRAPAAADVAVMGPVDLQPVRAHAAMAEVLATIDPQVGRVLVLVTSPEAAALLAASTQQGDRYRVHVVESSVLDDDDLEALAEALLAGRPAPQLMDTLRSRSGGLAGAAVETLRSWISSGQMISTARGLELATDSRAPAAQSAASATFRLLADQLDPVDMEICQVLAVVDRPATAIDVMNLLGSERRTERRRLHIEDRMDWLTERGILRPSGDAFVFRDRATQDVFELWLRPSLRRRTNEQLAAGHARDVDILESADERRSGSPGRRATDRVRAAH
ncbi:AfsR/SARP family transcriptional regulator [Aeromicrobium sp.]|uniref:AfsR/SARP family transcriptional regulator n=1 Tax=Aeromicrobium sp. TaxID=1871063 RepID=UPI003C3EF17D